MKGRYRVLWAILIVGFLSAFGLYAQKASRNAKSDQPSFYATHFPLGDVELLESPFKAAQDLNFKTLMEYDVDRMLTPYVRQSGLSATSDVKSPYYQWEYYHPAFTSFAWNPAMAMDGHLLGHYLSALSLAYSACHDSKQRAEFKERVSYIIQVLKDCQEVFDDDKDGMRGFIGGIPDNSIWKALLEADYRPYNQRGYWTPFYCEHKVLAGLRDAYLYTDNETAKEVFHKMCDWVIGVVSMFREDVMEMQILQWEPGAINEVLADAYVIFGDSKYLKGAQKFSHQILIENMNNDERNVFLDKKNTNHLAAMVLGFSRLNVVKHDARYGKSAQRFWADIVEHRMNAMGGVGVGGYFVPSTKAETQVANADGPDLCTTCNLLKLSQNLQSLSPEANYAEYCERALLNHVLASMDPQTGGFAFFTPMKAEAYRIYSTVNSSMWCCAGSGMETVNRFGDFIYSYSEDTLYVNQFIASELHSPKASLRQESTFPYGQVSRIKIQREGTYKLAVRHPSWATSGYSITVNGEPVKVKPRQIVEGRASYVYCGKTWKAGDVVEVHYPMSITTEACPGLPDKVAMFYGPTLLVAQTTNPEPGQSKYEKLLHEYGGDGMQDFSPQTREKFPNSAYSPMLICQPGEVSSRTSLKDSKKLLFEVDATAPGSSWEKVPVLPFFAAHHARYVLYWNHQSKDAWVKSAMYQDQVKKRQRELNTYDVVTPGELASEQEHKMQSSETASRGTYNGRTFRDAQADQWFEYTLNVQKVGRSLTQDNNVELYCRFTVIDVGRKCSISIDGEEIATYRVSSKDFGRDKTFDKTFDVPPHLLQNKSEVTVRFASVEGSLVPRVFRIRIMKAIEY